MSNGVERTRLQLRRLARLLDSSIRLPGGYRIGIDGFIGLVPGAGDVVSALLSMYIVVTALRLRLPGSILARMGLYVLVDFFVGIIPLFGDLFDFTFKVNERNVRLIDAYLDNPAKTRSRSRWLIAAFVGCTAAAGLLVLATGVVIVRFVWTAISAGAGNL